MDFLAQDPQRKLFDRLTVFADNWGDPYNVARLDAERTGTYRFTFDYRNIDYFNFLPSFANPAAQQGRLSTSAPLISTGACGTPSSNSGQASASFPIVGFSRDSGFGNGITPFVANNNEYPVATSLNDQTNNYRGGLRLEFNRWHATVEQGGTTFKDDQRVFTDDRNFGNRATPLLGQTLVLNRLNQAYGIRGRSLFSRALLTASPANVAEPLRPVPVQPAAHRCQLRGGCQRPLCTLGRPASLTPSRAWLPARRSSRTRPAISAPSFVPTPRSGFWRAS